MSDLSPQPDPVIEPGEPNPGGADAIEHDEDTEPLTRDLSPDDNPAVEDALPDEMKQPEKTDSGESEEVSPEKESQV